MMREIHLLVASCMHLTGAGIEPATQATLRRPGTLTHAQLSTSSVRDGALCGAKGQTQLCPAQSAVASVQESCLLLGSAPGF